MSQFSFSRGSVRTRRQNTVRSAYLGLRAGKEAKVWHRAFLKAQRVQEGYQPADNTPLFLTDYEAMALVLLEISARLGPASMLPVESWIKMLALLSTKAQLGDKKGVRDFGRGLRLGKIHGQYDNYAFSGKKHEFSTEKMVALLRHMGQYTAFVRCLEDLRQAEKWMLGAPPMEAQLLNLSRAMEEFFTTPVGRSATFRPDDYDFFSAGNIMTMGMLILALCSLPAGGGGFVPYLLYGLDVGLHAGMVVNMGVEYGDWQRTGRVTGGSGTWGAVSEALGTGLAVHSLANLGTKAWTSNFLRRQRGRLFTTNGRKVPLSSTNRSFLQRAGLLPIDATPEMYPSGLLRRLAGSRTQLKWAKSGMGIMSEGFSWRVKKRQVQRTGRPLTSSDYFWLWTKLGANLSRGLRFKRTYDVLSATGKVKSIYSKLEEK